MDVCGSVWKGAKNIYHNKRVKALLYIKDEQVAKKQQ